MSAATLRRLIVIGLIALWEILPRAGVIPELFLPSLSSTLAAGWNEAGEYGHALAVTLYEVAISMAFACGGGILLGAIVGSLPRPRILIMPMVSSLYAVPLVILYPVFTVWLGIGSESKIAFASIYGFLPTMLATAAGIQTIDPQLLLAARSMGATLSQRLVRVIIPAAIPTVLSGPARRRRAGDRRRGGVGDADLVRRHRLSDLALPHHSRQPACLRRRAAGAGDGDRLQRRDQMDRAQGRDLADRDPAPGSAPPTKSPPAPCSLRPDGARVFDLTLTFDNGPEPGVTPRVLDILRERGIKTTFFVIGEKLGDPERRRLAARAHDEGHWIGNHTFTHSVPLGQQRDAGDGTKRDRPDAGRDRRPRAPQPLVSAVRRRRQSRRAAVEAFRGRISHAQQV